MQNVNLLASRRLASAATTLSTFPTHPYSRILRRPRCSHRALTLPARQTVNQGRAPEPQPTVTREDGARTLRTREHGNKSLPMPVFMDPVVWPNRQKYKQPKPAITNTTELTDFQKKLAANPYAQALALPVRHCSMTRARLPNHFLIPLSFTLRREPIPASSPTSPETPPNPTIYGAVIPFSRTPGDGKRHYVLARPVALQLMSKSKRWPKTVPLSMRLKFARLTRRKVDNLRVESIWRWSNQMHDEILQHLQQDAVRRISIAFRKAAQEASDARAWAVVPQEGEVRDLAAEGRLCWVLRFAEREAVTEDLRTPDDWPVFDMRFLLGQDSAAKLFGKISRAKQMNTSEVLLVQHAKSEHVVRALLVLQTYLGGDVL